MRIKAPATTSQYQSLGRLSAVTLLAGLAAGCSTSAFQLSEPVFTGSTANQQQIISAQAGSYSTPAPAYAAAPAYPQAQGSGVSRQELPPPPGAAATAYSPAAPSAQPIAPMASVPQPYTPPKPYAASGLPTPMGQVATAPRPAAPAAPIAANAGATMQATAPLPVRRGTPPRSLGEQAQSIAMVQAPQPMAQGPGIQVASINPTGQVPAQMTAPQPVAPAPQAAAPAPMQQASIAPTAPVEAAPAASDGASGFRWPVRGRVISGFGKKPSGERNDGINLAVPEGTSVKAADDGEVIYAGNELKSYGNLVLVRHANGWVSAYAHNSELKVKRGEKIRRGQIVALSGMSGGVTTPQVHFELRKDATPVDPIAHLSEG